MDGCGDRVRRRRTGTGGRIPDDAAGLDVGMERGCLQDGSGRFRMVPDGSVADCVRIVCGLRADLRGQ